MKKGLSIIIWLLALGPLIPTDAQVLSDDGWLNYNLNKEWQTYQYRSKDDLYLLREK